MPIMLNNGDAPNRLILMFINLTGLVVINPNTCHGKF